MYTVVYTHSRQDWRTKFFADGNAESKQMVAEIDSLTRGAVGFLNASSTMSPDFNSNIVTVVWKDKAAADQYEADNKEFLDDYRSARLVYDLIEHTVTTIEAA